MSAPNDAARYFDCAFDILATQGYGGLKLAPLCERMGVTTGAFYHHFTNWGTFTTALLEHWRQERTRRLVALARLESDPLDQLQVLIDATMELPHGAEAAIRVWSAIDPAVRRLQESVDRERHDFVRKAFAALVDTKEADRLATLGLYLLIGFEQAEPLRDPEALRWAMHALKKTAADRAARRSAP
ncbi:TetR/AcrR family transcriptional regulator [Streptomyces mirabilis]|uniref:TetR/AcrR family transcriptional regulator n=1 Tax=Streptomyces mirabilis TaxID=68239 RepID=UPI0033314A13